MNVQNIFLYSSLEYISDEEEVPDNLRWEYDLNDYIGTAMLHNTDTETWGNVLNYILGHVICERI